MMKYFWTLLFLLPALAFAETKKIEGTTNVEDAMIALAAADNNYGASEYLFLSNERYALIRAKNVASELGAGATITGCVCSLYSYSGSISAIYGAFAIFKSWEEGTQNNAYCSSPGCSWNDWGCLVNEWATEGCLCARDAGVDNSNDDGDCTDANADRKATAESSIDVTTTGWYAWEISTALAQAWYDGTKNEEGIAIVYISGSTELKGFRSTEYGSNQPFFVFTYTTEEPEAAGQVIIINK